MFFFDNYHKHSKTSKTPQSYQNPIEDLTKDRQNLLDNIHENKDNLMLKQDDFYRLLGERAEEYRGLEKRIKEHKIPSNISLVYVEKKS